MTEPSERAEAIPPGHRHVAQVRDALERWNRGTPAIIPAEVHPDLELWTLFSSLSGEPYRGLDGLTQWLADITEHFDRWEVSYDAFHPAGDHTVVALVTVAVRARGSGLEMTQQLAWIVEFAGDQFRLIRSFAGHHEAMAAAGLESGPPAS